MMSDVPHTRPISVFAGSENEQIRTSLNLERSTYEGPVGILSGLSHAADAAGIPTASLWASNSVSWNRYDGTHTLQVIAPASLLPAAMGRAAVWLLNGVSTSLTTLLVLLVLGGQPTGVLGLVILALYVSWLRGEKSWWVPAG